jgi:hypothetical protein
MQNRLSHQLLAPAIKGILAFPRGILMCAVVLLLVAVPNIHGADSPGKSSGSSKVDFSREVRPILAGHCFKCHGMDEGARKAKMRLDVREAALKPAKSGELPIVPGKPDQSELMHRILAENEDDIMPPPGARNPLTAAEKEVLRKWIAQGAQYDPHWAFIPPKQSPLPKVHDKSWPQNPIDYFVLARLEKEGSILHRARINTLWSVAFTWT